MEFTKELTDNIIDGEFKSPQLLDEMFIIIYDGKIFAPKQGRMFHLTREDAMKHFYNEYHWRAKSKYKKHFFGVEYWKKHPNIDLTDRQIWEEFKKFINKDCKFEITKWKYAKQDVCS